MAENKPRPIFRRALGFFKPYWKAVGFVLLLTLVTTGINAVGPLMQKYVLDQLVAGVQQHGLGRSLLMPIGLMIGLLLITETVNVVSSILSGKTRVAVDFRLRDVVISYVYNLPMSFH